MKKKFGNFSLNSQGFRRQPGVFSLDTSAFMMNTNITFFSGRGVWGGENLVVVGGVKWIKIINDSGGEKKKKHHTPKPKTNRKKKTKTKPRELPIESLR